MEVRDRERVFRSLIPRGGFHVMEQDSLGLFVWTEGCFGLRLPTRERYLALRACYYGRRGRLEVSHAGFEVAGIRLHQGWHTYPVDLGRPLEGDLELELNEIIPVPGDARELGLMIREVRPLDTGERHDRLQKVLTNRERNESEYAAGRSVLQSFPPNLRVNVVSGCNMLRTCSYCERDWVRSQEGHNGVTFTADTLGELGDFYQCAEELVDCSYGEPFLNEDLGRIIERTDRDYKRFELTSSGQLLGPERRHLLLGRQVLLYVSLDAADGDGYHRYRDADFDRVIGNLRALCREREAHRERPRVAASFIVMRSNMNEIPRFTDLMQEVGVDFIKLRTLFADYRHPVGGDQDRELDFDYRSEMVPIDELAFVTEEAAAYAAGKGLDLIAETDFGKNDTGESRPLCAEPWESLYALNRGFIPCCFTKHPVAVWRPHPDGPLQELLAEVWNGSGFRNIRSELAAGRFPPHCLEAGNCPIVRRSAA
jgi:MoaA/NifB/PqqE/SkfB family radical SAM enzyme